MPIVKIYVTLKEGILDPQGETVQRGLSSLGFQGIAQVRMGKYLEVTVESGTREAIEAQVRQMCEKLLANPVIENYRFEMRES